MAYPTTALSLDMLVPSDQAQERLTSSDSHADGVTECRIEGGKARLSARRWADTKSAVKDELEAFYSTRPEVDRLFHGIGQLELPAHA